MSPWVSPKSCLTQILPQAIEIRIDLERAWESFFADCCVLTRQLTLNFLNKVSGPGEGVKCPHQQQLKKTSKKLCCQFHFKN